jgi:response regulator RpfG family c-di-GMP phosphodiesterase
MDSDSFSWSKGEDSSSSIGNRLEISYANIEETQKEVVFTMGAIGETRSKETGNHVKRVAQYSKVFALYYGLSEENAEMLKQASPMHDIGKMTVPHEILHKPGKYTPEEYEVMKQHTIQGARLFQNQQSDFDEAAGIVALNHHERWDGNGYPGHIDFITGRPKPGFELSNGMAKGKKGTEIPLFGRIVALADVFDALSSERSYKEAWAENTILTMIEKSAGKHFDPELVKIFFSRYDMIRSIHQRYKENTNNSESSWQI